jgi:two-component system alkaline phosphatase synthesis response regulator PhoP
MKKDYQLLIIDDDVNLRGEITRFLEKAGYKVAVAGTAKEGLGLMAKLKPDLLLLDISLPDSLGFEVCRLIRSNPEMNATRIVMISSHDTEQEIIHGLELGADDYLVKPFSAPILSAHINAVLRRESRASSAKSETLQIGPLEINPNKFIVSKNGTEIKLTFTEFKILHFLASRPGWVFTRQQIVTAVKEQEFSITERSVDVQMVNLRKKLGEPDEYIETVRGVGYKVKELAAISQQAS